MHVISDLKTSIREASFNLSHSSGELYRSRLNAPNGHVDSWQSSDEDRIDKINRRLFFMHDVVKSGRFIMDQMDKT